MAKIEISDAAWFAMCGILNRVKDSREVISRWELEAALNVTASPGLKLHAVLREEGVLNAGWRDYDAAHHAGMERAALKLGVDQ